MDQSSFNLAYLNEQSWSLVIQLLTLVAATVFAALQFRINTRLKDIEDVVAITMLPSNPRPGGAHLQIANVGKINVYLQKSEIGTNHESSAKPMLIPAGHNSFLEVLIPVYSPGQSMPVKIFLLDESGEKFVSTGEVTVDNVATAINTSGQVIGGSGTPSHTIILPQVVAVKAYKTVKEKWVL
jgi:hypothetical protein